MAALKMEYVITNAKAGMAPSIKTAIMLAPGKKYGPAIIVKMNPPVTFMIDIEMMNWSKNPKRLMSPVASLAKTFFSDKITCLVI